MSVVSIIVAILIFSFIIIFHELGHFSVAKAFDVRVNEFTLGLGPTLFSIQGKETKFCLNLLPFGGSCVMEGEDEESSDERAFNKKPLWQKFLIVFAGPLFNFILAFLLSLIFIGALGYDAPVVENLMEGYPAEEAGLLPGDKIISINGERTYLFQEITLMILTSRSDDWDVVVLRNGEKMHFDVKIRDDETNGRMLGVVAADKINCANIKIFEYSFYEVRYWLIASVKSIGMLFTGRLTRDDVAGPVGVAQVIGSTIQQTKEYGFLTVFVNLVDIALLLSVNLAIMNLLPFPGLDGGRIVFLLAELILRRKIPRKFEAVVTLVGFAALMILMVVVLFNDVSKFFR